MNYFFGKISRLLALLTINLNEDFGNSLVRLSSANFSKFCSSDQDKILLGSVPFIPHPYNHFPSSVLEELRKVPVRDTTNQESECTERIETIWRMYRTY